jgi:hypothetical protein
MRAGNDTFSGIPTRPRKDLLRDDILRVARVARGIKEVARALLGWISNGGILEGAEGLDLYVKVGEGVTVEIHCEEEHGTPWASLTIWSHRVEAPLGRLGRR